MKCSSQRNCNPEIKCEVTLIWDGLNEVQFPKELQRTAAKYVTQLSLPQ